MFNTEQYLITSSIAGTRMHAHACAHADAARTHSARNEQWAPQMHDKMGALEATRAPQLHAKMGALEAPRAPQIAIAPTSSQSPDLSVKIPPSHGATLPNKESLQYGSRGHTPQRTGALSVYS